MRTLSVVIPALNQVHNITHVLDSVPYEKLAHLGWATEVVVVDNNSTDGTGEVARQHGARVVHETRRGYGNAYRAGFTHATGEVIATGDADRTYPLDHLPQLLEEFLGRRFDFMSTNRLRRANRTAMKPSHSVGNHVLSQVSRTLFGHDYVDSQSGMWIFRRDIWAQLDVRSPGMGFSQELKNEAYVRGFVCGEVPIDYRPRGGEVKLNAVRDGVGNLRQLFEHRRRNTRTVAAPAAVIPVQRVAALEVGLAPKTLLIPTQRGAQHDAVRGDAHQSDQARRSTPMEQPAPRSSVDAST